MSTATPKPSNGDIELAANQTAPLVAASEEPSSVVTSGGSRLDKRLVLGGLGSRLGALYSGMFHEGLVRAEIEQRVVLRACFCLFFCYVFFSSFTIVTTNSRCR